MKLIFKQIGLLLSALVALYGLLLVVSLLCVPRSELGQRLNAASAGSSLFLTEPKYVFMARSQLNSLDDKAILVGASNMLVGFKQAQVQALVPGMQVHNLSVGGSNITQIKQIVDLVREVQTPDARRHNTWVVGLWYGVFAEDKARWYTPDRHGGDTDIDIERYRYGFYRRTDTGPVPVLPPRYLDVGATLIHPYLVLDRAARDVTAALRASLSGRPVGTTDAQRNAAVSSLEQQRKYFEFWRAYMGDTDSLTEAPFQVLETMVNSILADGGHVVLVDMPIPQWHEKGSPLWADYRRRIDPMLAQLQTHPQVKVLKMEDANADADYLDEVHPKPRVTPAWAQRLATVLNAQTP